MITKRIFYLSLLVLWPVVYSVPHYQEQFLQANELYKNAEYSKALSIYENMPTKSPQLYYNLGNCSYKLGNLGKALVYYRRAEHDWGLFNREELQANIAMVKEQLDKKHGLKKRDTRKFVLMVQATKRLKERFVSLIKAMSLFMLQLFFLFIWFILFVYIRYLYTRRHKFVLLTLFLFTTLCGTMLAVKYNMSLRTYGIVVAEKTNLLSGPGVDFQILGVLREGDEGIVKKESTNHYKVKVNGQFGWVPSEAFEKI